MGKKWVWNRYNLHIANLLHTQQIKQLLAYPQGNPHKMDTSAGIAGFFFCWTSQVFWRFDWCRDRALETILLTA
jgi:hypothetical protein